MKLFYGLMYIKGKERRKAMDIDYENAVKLHKDTVYKIAYVQCSSEADAEDVFQDVFLTLYSCSKKFESEEHLKAWLIRVTVNRCRQLHRSSWFRKKAELDENATSVCIDEDCGSDGAAVIAAVKALPEKYRPIVMMYYYEELSCGEIADILKMNEATVRTRLRRAREMLKEDLKEVWQND